MLKLILASLIMVSFLNAAITMKPDYEYELDTWGSNSEIYEFTPKANKKMTCIMYMLDNAKAMGLQCFPKPEFMNLKTK